MSDKPRSQHDAARARALEMYPDIYSLVPDYEIEPGWWKLKWRPLWKKTILVYKSWGYRTYGLGFRCWRGDACNGWGRSIKHFSIEFTLIKWTINAWIKWDYHVMAKGPADMGFEYPLALTEGKPGPE